VKVNEKNIDDGIGLSLYRARFLRKKQSRFFRIREVIRIVRFDDSKCMVVIQYIDMRTSFSCHLIDKGTSRSGHTLSSIYQNGIHLL
jgi:hypothetical protein